MSNYITDHNASARAVFSSAVPTEQLVRDMGGWGMSTIYSSHALPPNLASGEDIKQYARDREQGLGPGVICPPGGASVGIVTMPVGAMSPLHRTMTLDVGVILEGVAELHLDSGEVKVLKAGDTFVQRGTKHQWKNVTPDDGQMRMFYHAQPIVAPLEVGGQKLETDWGM